MDTLTDEQLVSNYLAGDEQSFRFLVERYLHSVYSFIYRYVQSDVDAEDIAQDVFVSVWKNIKSFDSDKKFKTWVFAIAKNASLNWLKKKKPVLFSRLSQKDGDGESSESSIYESIADPSPLPDALFNRSDIALRISEAIARLSAIYRTVLFMRFNNHLTFREIAESLGESLHTIKSRYRRGVVLLRKNVNF